MRSIEEFEFHHTLEATPGLSIVFFTGVGCASCRHWKRLFETQPPDFPDLQLFEVDAERSQALTREFDVFHLPALFLYRDGQFHRPLQAEASPQGLQRAIELALELPSEEAP
ncbi:hypothetical protein BOW53_04100 [Solemya pervernicosa gill symbiont]|uniref:Thioredoxin domain-containing protein n=2 Tax=Gammaproteobacteria incertae sedis TaxID=118884 RepID=A0A1T2L8E9_9GAMM|nr:hypothetical protein BOW53_04100 [Solemya pervernicosa gill symbiont]QKQ28321.1 thioredoxin family protein [Candidatus Reidiella endopervernicosa]